MDSPHRPLMSLLVYNKIQNGFRPPFWKTQNSNNSAAIWVSHEIWYGGWHGQYATYPCVTFAPLFEMSSQNLIRRCTWTGHNVPEHHFWPIIKSKMAAGFCNAGPSNLGYFRAFQTCSDILTYTTLPYWIQFNALNLVAIKHICRKSGSETENGILVTEVPSYDSSDRSNIGAAVFNSFLILPAIQAKL